MKLGRPEGPDSLIYLVAMVASTLVVSIAVSLQLAQWGHPGAHWWWCTVLGAC